MTSDNTLHPNIASTVQFSLFQDTFLPETNADRLMSDNIIATAIWVRSGSVVHSTKHLKSGEGAFVDAADQLQNHSADSAQLMRFTLSTSMNPQPTISTREGIKSKLIFSQATTVTDSHVIFRLDQVDFPPSATAYKHTHPGPGIRYLVHGGLTLHGDHGTQLVQTGDAWFEAANSPVKAVAIDSQTSCFVRAMLLPVEYEARPTFTLHDKNDATKPTLQRNTRHCEKAITIESVSH